MSNSALDLEQLNGNGSEDFVTAPPAPEQLTIGAIEASIRATIEPLRQQLKLVEGRERLILADLEETRAMKTRLVSTLRKLDPTMPGLGTKPGPKKKGGYTRAGSVPSEEVMNVFRAAVDQVALEFPDGFTRNRVGEQLKANGHGMGDLRQAQAIDELHRSGYLTLHKLVVGGNKSFKRTEDL